MAILLMQCQICYIVDGVHQILLFCVINIFSNFVHDFNMYVFEVQCMLKEYGLNQDVFKVGGT